MPWTIHTDHLMTRRKSFHNVEDDKGNFVFRHRFIGPCFDYLAAEEVRDYYISTPSALIHVTEGERTKQERLL